jgi:outer membrane protein
MAKRFVLFLAVLVLPWGVRAQTGKDRAVRIEPAPRSGGWTGWLRGPYQPRDVAAVDFSNSDRTDALLRGGKLYLSLQDAIALALENNLDIELQRFGQPIAGTDLLRARAGATLRGVPLSVRELPFGVGGPGAPLLTSIGAYNPQASVAANIGELGGITAQERNLSVLGTASGSLGPRLPTYDPSVSTSLNWGRQSNPVYNSSSVGINPLLIDALGANLGLQRGFASGTNISLGYANNRQRGNWPTVDYNPFTTAALGFTVTQRLLQGFGPAVNRRYIRIAGNNERVSSEVFREQVISTVSSVIRLYWDLVSLNEDVRVKRDALRVSEKLLENNEVQVDAGTLAPIEAKRAQVEVARWRQDVTNAENLVVQQELILKRALTRTGLSDSLIREAGIVPLDSIEVPPRDDIQPVQDLVASAFRNRPDLAGARLQIENSQISLRGAKNALLPSLDLFGTVQNNAFAGQTNSALLPSSSFTPVTNPLYLGGAGSILSQIFSHDFPNYSVGFQLTIPIRNRIAQADAIRDQLELRQSQVRLHNLEEQVRLEIQSALVALTRARTGYEAALQTRRLQEEALEAEKERYAVGASTSFFVIQYERDLAQARTTELIARGNYAKARNALDRALGVTLERNSVQISEARAGVVPAMPKAPPQ